MATVASRTGEAFAVLLAGMRKNVLNIFRVGPKSGYFYLNARVDGDDEVGSQEQGAIDASIGSKRYADVAAAIAGARMGGLSKFGSLLAELPERLAYSARGQFSEWPEYAEEILSSSGITHNAYTRSETFLLFLSAKLANMLGHDVRPYTFFYDYAVFEAYRRDFAYSAKLQSAGSDEVDDDERDREAARDYPYDKGRWRAWMRDSPNLDRRW